MVLWKRRNYWWHSPLKFSICYFIDWFYGLIMDWLWCLSFLWEPGGWPGRPRQWWSRLLSRRKALNTTRTDHSYSCVVNTFFTCLGFELCEFFEHRVECLVCPYNQFFNESHIMLNHLYKNHRESGWEHYDSKYPCLHELGNIKNKAGDFVVAAHRVYPPILESLKHSYPSPFGIQSKSRSFLLEDVTSSWNWWRVMRTRGESS